MRDNIYIKWLAHRIINQYGICPCGVFCLIKGLSQSVEYFLLSHLQIYRVFALCQAGC